MTGEQTAAKLIESGIIGNMDRLPTLEECQDAVDKTPATTFTAEEVLAECEAHFKRYHYYMVPREALLWMHLGNRA
jgi:hypothetical protein